MSLNQLTLISTLIWSRNFRKNSKKTYQSSQDKNKRRLSNTRLWNKAIIISKKDKAKRSSGRLLWNTTWKNLSYHGDLLIIIYPYEYHFFVGQLLKYSPYSLTISLTGLSTNQLTASISEESMSWVAL